jgi:hypothetical protein
MDFGFRCVFCLASEPEVGDLEPFGGFEIEHFKPQSQFGWLKNYYRNLLWACHACNRAKGNTWPSQEELAAGWRFVDPCADAPGDHLALSSGGLQVGPVDGSKVGDFTITEVDLNSDVQIERRKERMKVTKAVHVIEATLETLRQRAHEPDVVAAVAEFEVQLAELKPRIVPWDAPLACACRPGMQATPTGRRLTRKQRKADRLRKTNSAAP